MSERLETQQELETLKAWKSSSDSEKTALSAQVASLEVSWQWNRWNEEQEGWYQTTISSKHLVCAQFDTLEQELRQTFKLQSEINLIPFIPRWIWFRWDNRNSVDVQKR